MLNGKGRGCIRMSHVTGNTLLMTTPAVSEEVGHSKLLHPLEFGMLRSRISRYVYYSDFNLLV